MTYYILVCILRISDNRLIENYQCGKIYGKIKEIIYCVIFNIFCPIMHVLISYSLSECDIKYERNNIEYVIQSEHDLNLWDKC